MNDSKVRIYLRGKTEPIELDGIGTDKDGTWEIHIVFKQDYVWVKRTWLTSHAEQALYTFPRFNLYYVDWGNYLEDTSGRPESI